MIIPRQQVLFLCMMILMNKFITKDLNLKHPNNDACLDIIFQLRYGDWTVCPICNSNTKFYKVTNRKCYACQSCGFQLHPLANTIYHKSSTPLGYWFHAIYLLSVSKNGVSAKELQRQIGVTYKTAWRIVQQIRAFMKQPKLLYPRKLSK